MDLLRTLSLAGLFVTPLAAQDRPAEPGLRMQLRELLDCEKPPATVEIDGRIFELDRLDQPAKKLEGVRHSAAVIDLIVMRLLADRMRGAGYYLSDEEFEEDYAAHVESLNQPFFSMKAKLDGYPSVATFKQWWRLRRSFEKSIEKEITDKALTAYMRRDDTVLSPQRMAFDAVFFLARDEARGRWDFAAAAARAKQARAAMVGGDLAEARKLGESYTSKSILGPGMIRRELGENAYTDLAIGTSAVAQFFPNSKPGDVIGPIRTYDSYWIVKVTRRTISGLKSVGIQDPNRRKMVRQAYVDDRFREWVRATLGKILLKRKPAK